MFQPSHWLQTRQSASKGSNRSLFVHCCPFLRSLVPLSMLGLLCAILWLPYGWIPTSLYVGYMRAVEGARGYSRHPWHPWSKLYLVARGDTT